ncbi:hypothetical protein D3C83_15290 [compost metagenome]
MREVNDLEVVEDGDRRTAAHLVDQVLQERLQHHLGVDGAQVSGTDAEHFRPQQEAPSEPPDVAEVLERVERTPRGRRTEVGQRRDFAQRQLRMVAREGLQHAQAAVERGHEVGALFEVRLFRHAKRAGL